MLLFLADAVHLARHKHILANGIITSSEAYPNIEPIGMFELSKLRAPLALYFNRFSRFYFPSISFQTREGLTNILSDIDQKQFMTEAVVLKASPLVGKLIHQSDIAKMSGHEFLML